jgi:hypothetical protein
MGKFCEAYGDHQLSELTVDTILDFLNQLTEGCKPQTKRIRYGHLAAFFNFIKNNIISDFTSPCDSKMLRKLYRPRVGVKRNFDRINLLQISTIFAVFYSFYIIKEATRCCGWSDVLTNCDLYIL